MTGSEYFDAISNFVQARNGIFYSTGYAREASLTIYSKRQNHQTNLLLVIQEFTELLS